MAGVPERARLSAILRRRPHRNAFVVIAVTVLMAALFVASYSLALGRPAPRHISAALVGPDTPVVGRMVAATNGSLDLAPYPSLAAALAGVHQQRVYAVLVTGVDPPRLMVASTAGLSVARVLEQAAQKVVTPAGSPRIVDVRPLPPSDPQGLVSFYVTLAATILGFVSAFQLRANAADLTLRAWLAVVATLAVLGGLVLTAVVGPIIGALSGGFAELWLALSAEVAASALFASAMLVLIGRWAILPTWGLFVLLGNTSSGGAVAPPLLPPFYAFIGRFLPPGATVNIIHTAIYFSDAQHAAPFVVQAVWLAILIVALLVFSRLRGRAPGGRVIATATPARTATPRGTATPYGTARWPGDDDSDMTAEPVNLTTALASFDEVYSPRIVARMNDYDVRVAHVAGEHVWHVHSGTDEFFLVLEGQFHVALRDAEGAERTVVLNRGDTFVVPKGMAHRPSSPGGSILMFEPAGTSTTGDSHEGEIPDHVDSTVGHDLI